LRSIIASYRRLTHPANVINRNCSGAVLMSTATYLAWSLSRVGETRPVHVSQEPKVTDLSRRSHSGTRRDPLFTDEFRELLRTAGVKCLKLPAHSPNLNAFAERFVLSIKSECLDKLVLLGERHLRLAVAEFVEHYHLERHHQGRGNQLIARPPTTMRAANSTSPVARRERLGGRLNFYHRHAA